MLPECIFGSRTVYLSLTQDRGPKFILITVPQRKKLICVFLTATEDYGTELHPVQILQQRKYLLMGTVIVGFGLFVFDHNKKNT